MKGQFFNKSEASIYLLGYEDVAYINKLLKEKLLGFRNLPFKKTSKKIYKGDLDRMIQGLPLVEGR